MSVLRISGSTQAHDPIEIQAPSKPLRPPLSRDVSILSYSDVSRIAMRRSSIDRGSGRVMGIYAASAEPSIPKASSFARNRFFETIAAKSLVARPSFGIYHGLFAQFLRQSDLFDLFEDAVPMTALALQNLKQLDEKALQRMFLACRSLVYHRQIDKVFMSDTLAHASSKMMGLLICVYVLFGPKKMEEAATLAGQSISHDERVEKRYIKLLLASAAALSSPDHPCSFEQLQMLCRTQILNLDTGPTRSHPSQMKALMQKITRCLAGRGTEKFKWRDPNVEWNLPTNPPVASNSPSENHFVVVEPDEILESPKRSVADVVTSIGKNLWVNCWLKKIE